MSIKGIELMEKYKSVEPANNKEDNDELTSFDTSNKIN
jgi:hypothetical protein